MSERAVPPFTGAVVAPSAVTEGEAGPTTHAVMAVSPIALGVMAVEAAPTEPMPAAEVPTMVTTVMTMPAAKRKAMAHHPPAADTTEAVMAPAMPAAEGMMAPTVPAAKRKAMAHHPPAAATAETVMAPAMPAGETKALMAPAVETVMMAHAMTAESAHAKVMAKAVPALASASTHAPAAEIAMAAPTGPRRSMPRTVFR